MKNFWLERRGPQKTKINIWASAEVSNCGVEHILETIEVVIPDTEMTFLKSNRPGEKGVFDMQKYNPMTAIAPELDNMLYHRRIGKALAKRNAEGTFNGKPVSPKIMKEQWTPGEGNKLFKQGTGEYMVFYIRNETAYKSGATAGYIEKTDWKATNND